MNTDLLAEERRHLEQAVAYRQRMQKRTARLTAAGGSAQGQRAVAQLLAERAEGLADTSRLPAFGRIDYADDAEHGQSRFHIGVRHIHDDYGDPVVIDWRAPAARPFYTASMAHPAGLERRRRFVTEDEELIDVVEESFLDELEDALDGDLVEGVAGRERGATMRDIVATIHAEQDALIRAPLDRTLVVQGGPGTGKTAVALHRAAFLLYEHRERLERDGILIVGPNPAFMRYIADVLPGLGELEVEQRDLDSVTRFAAVAPAGPEEAQRLKGDARMAAVLRRAVAAHRTMWSEELVVALRHRRRRLRLAAAEVDSLIEDLARQPLSWSAGRDQLRERLVDALVSTARAQGVLSSHADAQPVESDARAAPALRRMLDRVWPALTPEAVLGHVLADPARLAAAADGLLDDAEQHTLLRASTGAGAEGRWAPEDLPLLDELDFSVSKEAPRSAHVVVDEAQDLSPMQLRMLARRGALSMTIVGDLAQGSSPWAARTWGDVLSLLDQSGADVMALTLGYRVPQRHLELANRLLEPIAVDVPRSTSIREGDAPVVRTLSSPDAVLAGLADEVVALLERGGSVGVIVPEGVAAEAAAMLTHSGIDHRLPGEVESEASVCLAEAAQAKGLEFDHVVVVEPASIVADSARGLSLLYVALTRAVRHLVVLHARPLPAGLADRAA